MRGGGDTSSGRSRPHAARAQRFATLRAVTGMRSALPSSCASSHDAAEAAPRAAQLRQLHPEAFVPRPRIYWLDLGLSAALGWSAFAAAGSTGGPLWLRAPAAGLAVLALYRAVLFIHELAHLRRGAVPGLEAAWNLVVGLPLMAPSLMYVGSHGDHHRRDVYGTRDDPEYETIASWSPARIVGASLLLLAVPGLLALRWGVLGPLSLLVPPLRRALVGRGSTLVINGAYRRPAPGRRERRRWLLGELGAAAFFWLAVAAFASGAVGLQWLGLWYGVTASILVLNHVRTLAAHRYAGDGAPMDTTGQLLDSVNLVGPAWLQVLLAPVGLRYHALHHLAPAIPYHALGRVHRTLSASLPEASPYHRAGRRGLHHALAELLRAGGPKTLALSGAPASAAGARSPASRTGRDAAAGGP